MAIVLGVLSLNNSDIFELDSAPNTGLGVVEPTIIGDLAIVQNTLGLWQKSGNTNTDWVLISSSFIEKLKNINNQTVTTTNYTNISELTSSQLGIGYYKFSFNGIFQSPNLNTGIGVRLGLISGSVNLLYGKWRISQAVNGINKDFIYDQLDQNTNVTSTSVSAINTNFVVLGDGVISIASPSVCAIQLRAETNNQAVSIRSGSILKLELV